MVIIIGLHFDTGNTRIKLRALGVFNHLTLRKRKLSYF